MADPQTIFSVGSSVISSVLGFGGGGTGFATLKRVLQQAQAATRKPAGPQSPLVPTSEPPLAGSLPEGTVGIGVPIPEIFRSRLLDIIRASRNVPFPGGGPGGRVGKQPRSKRERRAEEEFRKRQREQAEQQRKEQRRKPPGQIRKERREARERRGRELFEDLDRVGLRKNVPQIAGPRRTAGDIRRETRQRRRTKEQRPQDLPPLPGGGPDVPGRPVQGPPTPPGSFGEPPKPTPKAPQAASQARLEEIQVKATRKPAPLEEIKVTASRRPVPTPTPRAPITVPRSVQLGILAAATSLFSSSPGQAQAVTIQGQQFAATPTPTPRATPQTGLAPAPAGQRTRTRGRCEKRARKNRKTCWRGFYEEFSSGTKFRKWERVDCVTRKRI